MNTKVKILLTVLLFLGALDMSAEQQRTPGGYICTYVIEDGDTVPCFDLPVFYVYPPMEFKNKSQEKFYWKTVRDVKKTLPMARIVSYTLNKADRDISTMSKDDQKKYLKSLEKEVKQKYEPQVRDLTFGQGKMLIKLIDRETNMTSYELIKMYRGGFMATVYQGIARLFGANLKDEYDGKDKDKIVERVITLVQAGQL